MNQFDTFVITKSQELVSSDLLIDQTHSSVSTSLPVELNTFYLTKNPNKEAFHLNELLNSSQATLHIDNRTDTSIFPLFFNQVKISSNNVSNIMMVCVSVVFAINFSYLFAWFLRLPAPLEPNGLYPLLLCIIPVLCLFLFNANCNLTENNIFELLPWKHLNQHGVFKVDKIFYWRAITRLVITLGFLFFSLSCIWIHLIRNNTEFTSITLLSFLSNDELYHWLFNVESAHSLQKIVSYYMCLQVEVVAYIFCMLMINRNQTFLKNIKQENAKYLSITFVVFLLLTIIQSEISSFIQTKTCRIARIPWYLHIITVVYALIVACTDAILLKKENKVTNELNQLSRWDFDTRLGMWSPA